MQINMPITNTEYLLTQSDSIVSKTNLKGMITYINEDFLRVSGFTKAELIGTEHNIVRHPDMPAEAFADMWKALKAGRPWTGLVKNRCKNGDFYWVTANATPFYENDQLAGYMSVRTMPSREQINIAEVAYRLFRNGEAGNLTIQDGKIVKTSLLTRLNFCKNRTINARLINVISLLGLLLIIVGGVGLQGIKKANQGLRTVYEDRTLPINQLASIKELQLTSKLNIAAALITPTIEVIGKNVDEVAQHTDEINKIWVAYTATYLTTDEKNLADKFVNDRQLLVEQGFKPTLAALKAQDIILANKLFIDKVNMLYLPVSEDIKQLLQLQVTIAEQEFDLAQVHYEHTRNLIISLIFLSIIITFWRGLALIRVIVKPLHVAISDLGHIAQGNYTDIIEIERHDEVGKLMGALKAMQIKLGFDIADSKRSADETLRIKIGLDNVSSGVMIADNARNIVYANKSVINMLSKAEEDIHKRLANFHVNSLIGTNIDDFHVKPAHQEQLLATLNNSHIAQLVIGGHSMRITANPVINEQGQRLGTVAEWLDRTTEVAVENEIGKIVHGATLGDFTQRIHLQGKEGFFLQLGEGLNELLVTTEQGINDVVRVLNALSRSDLSQTISADYAGSFGCLKDDVNKTVEKLKDIINHIKEATDNINTGAKEIASGNNDLSHRTEEQAASLEETAASMEELTSTVQHNASNAKQANQLAVDATDIAGKGVEVVGQVVKTMDDINSSSRKIGDIISVIDDIAFQTNILALNAAVEAARAGEQGRGFAVVAVEVRNLAQRAATAAGEIKHLIDDSVTKVAGGSKLVAQAGQTMEEIVKSIHGVTVMMSEISAASSEQTAGILQVNQAIGQMDDVTQQNAALVEQAAAAAESLEEQANSLSGTVAQFKVDAYSHARNAISQTKSTGSSDDGRHSPKEPSLTRTVTVKKATKPIPQSSNDEWEEF